MKPGKILSIVAAIVVAMGLWMMPMSIIGLPDLTATEQRMIAIFAFAAIMWIAEAIPIWTTSVLTIVVMLLTVSNSSFAPLKHALGGQEIGPLVGYKDIMATFADPVIMLFMGGFILAIAATKYELDANLARVLLKPFGKKSEHVLLGFILITAIFSMFMSNTATAAMMLAILAPVLRILPQEGKGRIALALAIPIGANIGGIGTPIGTPPNAIVLGVLNNPEKLNMGISFGQWMMVMLPYVLVLLGIAWVVLLRLFPFKQKEIVIKIDGKFRTDWRAIVVYVTFALTVVLWATDKLTGINANVVALIPFAVFSITGIIGKDDLKEISWDVLWLVAGGFALGVGLDKTGLAEHMIEAIPFGSWPAVVMIVGAGVLCLLMSTFMSNTATAALLTPILAVIGAGMKTQLAPFGGIGTLLIGVALSASLAMALPISTPPNALAHATGLVEQKHMALVGIVMGVAGLLIGYVLLIGLGQVGYFGQ